MSTIVQAGISIIFVLFYILTMVGFATGLLKINEKKISINRGWFVLLTFPGVISLVAIIIGLLRL